MTTSHCNKSALVIFDIFCAPLEAKGAVLKSILDEMEDSVDYAKTYLRLGCDSYSKVWYQLYTAPNSANWPNILLVSELLPSLPFSRVCPSPQLKWNGYFQP